MNYMILPSTYWDVSNWTHAFDLTSCTFQFNLNWLDQKYIGKGKFRIQKMLCYWKLLLVSPIRWLSGGDFNTNDDWFKFNIRGGRNLYMEGYWNSSYICFVSINNDPCDLTTGS